MSDDKRSPGTREAQVTQQEHRPNVAEWTPEQVLDMAKMIDEQLSKLSVDDAVMCGFRTRETEAFRNGWIAAMRHVQTFGQMKPAETSGRVEEQPACERNSSSAREGEIPEPRATSGLAGPVPNAGSIPCRNDAKKGGGLMPTMLCHCGEGQSCVVCRSFRAAPDAPASQHSACAEILALDTSDVHSFVERARSIALREMGRSEARPDRSGWVRLKGRATPFNVGRISHRSEDAVHVDALSGSHIGWFPLDQVEPYEQGENACTSSSAATPATPPSPDASSPPIEAGSSSSATTAATSTSGSATPPPGRSSKTLEQVAADWLLTQPNEPDDLPALVRLLADVDSNAEKRGRGIAEIQASRRRSKAPAPQHLHTIAMCSGCETLWEQAKGLARETCAKDADAWADYWDEPGRLMPNERSTTAGALRSLARDFRRGLSRPDAPAPKKEGA